MNWAPADAGWPVSERILRWAARCPDQPAIVDGPLTLTYGEFVTRVSLLVSRLREFGVGRDSVVAVYLPRSAELVVAMTAVLVSGAAYLPVDINQPFESTRRMFRETSTKRLITISKLWSINGDAGPVPLYVDALGPTAQKAMAPPPPEPDALAYVTYANGTDGVMIEHAGLTNLVDWVGSTHEITLADHMTQLGEPSADAFALEVWPCLAHGATLHVVDRRLLDAPARLREWLCRTGITLCHLPPGLAERMLNERWPARPSLRGVLVDSLAGNPPTALPFRVHSTYGHTECTVVAASAEPTPGTPGRPPLGRPIHGITAYVLGADLTPVGDDQPGQLYLTGTGLARGYLRPQVPTGFMPDPFSAVAGARMYATGDLVRRDAEGVLHLVGHV